ncbi:MAG: endonuclease/exonuclease/phosphatase family protein, partial [Planctomycetes bacterium]|nr:endonuclease/exonuclease/phosphatase family protein [Planctomycetota bacterium]
ATSASAAALTTSSTAPVFSRIATLVPAGPLTQMSSGYLVGGGDPVRPPHVLEADRFSDRLPDQVPATLRVVAWNVEFGRYSQAVLDQLRSDPELVGADVIFLTEVPRHDPESNPPGINLAREAARLLRMDYVIAPSWYRALEVPGGGEHCTAILSKYPLGNVRHLRLTPAYDHYTRLRRIGGRHALAADLQIGTRRVGVTAVHLATRDFGPERALQADEILSDANLPGRPALQIVGGDFNTWNCSPFRWDCTDPRTAEACLRRFFDSGWADGTAGFRSFTQKGLGFFPQRLDWIFVRGLLLVPGRAIPTSAADHLPIFCDVALP